MGEGQTVSEAPTVVGEDGIQPINSSRAKERVVVVVIVVVVCADGDDASGDDVAGDDGSGGDLSTKYSNHLTVWLQHKSLAILAGATKLLCGHDAIHRHPGSPRGEQRGHVATASYSTQGSGG